MKTVSFTHPPNLYEFLLLSTKKEDTLKNVGNQTADGSHWLPYVKNVNGYRQLFGYQHSSKYLLLCSTEERNSYRFGGWVNDTVFIFWVNMEMNWGWVNDDRIVIFGWTVPLNDSFVCPYRNILINIRIWSCVYHINVISKTGHNIFYKSVKASWHIP